jgi:uncharacterized protein YndB with AHSA1/START domain
MAASDVPSSSSSSSSPPHDVETVELVIAAPASVIFDLLADPAKHQEIDGSGTVRDTTTGAQRLQLGSTFGMNMKAGIGYKMVSTVVEFDLDRRIAWQTTSPTPVLKSLVGGRIWRYELEPVEGGTLVRESWDIRQEKVKVLVRPLRGRTREGMTKTLARIAELVAS